MLLRDERQVRSRQEEQVEGRNREKMETQPQTQDLEKLAQEDKRIDELRYARGHRTGLAKKPLGEASEAYLKGYFAGRQESKIAELKRRYVGLDYEDNK